jgi:hypothetical protein
MYGEQQDVGFDAHSGRADRDQAARRHRLGGG